MFTRHTSATRPSGFSCRHAMACLLLAGSLGLANAAHAADYAITELTFTPSSINNHGQVVGERYLYDQGAVIDIGSLRADAGGVTIATFINNNGQIVGATETDEMRRFPNDIDEVWPLYRVTRAFVYEAGTMSAVGPRYPHSIAYAINDAGVVVGAGEYFDRGGQLGQSQAFLGDQEFYDAPCFDECLQGGTAPSSAIFAINNNGIILGSDSARGGAYLLNLNTGEATQFPYVGGDLNDLGQAVAGNFFFDGTAFTELYASVAAGEALALNNLGHFVGRFQLNGMDAAFLNDGSPVDLNTLIDPLSGWTLTSALDINDLGQIVGIGELNGVRKGFLLTPVPEPSAALMLLAGLLVVGVWTRRSKHGSV